jgi:Tol biopolymer transport system component
MQEVVVLKVGARRAIILLGVAMAVFFLASGLVPTEPSAQTTSPEGKIVFVKLGDIWVMDADGTNQTNLTNTPDTNEGEPAWSPDGTKIAFTGPGELNEDGSGGLDDIYVMDADPSTNDATSLTDTPDFLEYRASWAPSGAQLTFVRELEGPITSEQSDIFVMDADPATNDDAINLTQTDANEDDPAWSPDGTKIAFSGVRNGGEEILTMDPDGQNEEILTGDGSNAFDRAPDWSPDGTKVVFQKQSQVGGCCERWEIWAVNRNGSGDTNLTNDLSEEDIAHTGPSWSPDGSEITFTRTRPSVDGGQSDIYAMPAPATLPPPDESASATMSQDSGGAMDFAAADVLVRAASAQTTSETTVRRLTTDGLSTEPDWGRSARTACTLRGTSGADVLTGTSDADVICGGGGADLIRGRGGNDILKGAGGADTLYGGLGKDELRGGKGSDSLVGGGGADSHFGGDNNDILDSRDGVSDNDVLDCGFGTDTKVTDTTEKSIVSCER